MNNNKKKILFVIDSLNSGGAEKSLTNLLNSMNLKRVEVDLLLFVKEGLYLSLVPNEVNIIEANKKNKLFINKSVLYMLQKLRTFLIKFLKVKIHPAQLTWFFSKNEYFSMKKEYDYAIAYSQGIPTYFVHSKIKAKKKYSWVNTDYYRAGYNPVFDKNFYDNMNKVICVSEKASEIFRISHPYANVEIIKDVISDMLIKKMANLDNNYILEPNTINILTIGRLVEVKGYDLAISAGVILKNRNIKFHWYIIGEGPLENKLKYDIEKNKLNEYFTFLGITPNPYSFINKIDIYCQVSRFEGFGMAIAEAKILQKPVVATNFISIVNQIKNKSNGMICEMNGESIANTLIRVMKDNKLQQRIKENLKKEKNNHKNEIIKFEGLII